MKFSWCRPNRITMIGSASARCLHEQTRVLSVFHHPILFLGLCRACAVDISCDITPVLNLNAFPLSGCPRGRRKTSPVCNRYSIQSRVRFQCDPPGRLCSPTYSTFIDLLITAKPQLDNPDPAVRPPLIEKLRQVASLAESFTEQRPKSNKSWLQLSDELDQEGPLIPRTLSPINPRTNYIRFTNAENSHRRQSMEYFRFGAKDPA